VFVLALTAGGCHTMAPIVPQFGVETPALNHLGMSVMSAPWQIMIKNGVPYPGYVVLYAGDEKEPITESPLFPGDLGIDHRHYQPHREGMPITAKYFDPSGQF